MADLLRTAVGYNTHRRFFLNGSTCASSAFCEWILRFGQICRILPTQLYSHHHLKTASHAHLHPQKITGTDTHAIWHHSAGFFYGTSRTWRPRTGHAGRTVLGIYVGSKNERRSWCQSQNLKKFF